MGIIARYLFVTDLHIGGSHSSRTGVPLDDVLRKLEYCVGYANHVNARLLFGGDIFDKHVVAQEALNRTMDVLASCEVMPFCIWGNHDMLYRQRQNNYKCSLYTLGAAGLVRFIDGSSVLDAGGRVWLTNEEFPSPPEGVAAIGMYHAFLGIPDGVFSVNVSDFASVHCPMVVLLGHDHVPYSETRSGYVRFVRAGSLFRDCRGAQSERVPSMVLLSVSDSLEVCVSVEPLPADVVRPHEGLFKDVSVLVSGVGDEDVSAGGDFDALMEALSQESVPELDLTFEEALLRSSDDEGVRSYCLSRLAESNHNNK